jgi:nucleoside-diphosphate-sugar epimerase
VAGQAFNVGDPDQLSCDEFYGFFADAAGLTLPVVDDEPARPNGAFRRARRALYELATSEELASLAKRIAQVVPSHKLPAQLTEPIGELRDFFRRHAGIGASVYTRPEWRPPRGETLYRREALIRLDKAVARLGYRPPVTTREALDRTLEWARYAELID